MNSVLAEVGNGQGKRLMDKIRTKMASFLRLREGALAQHEAEFQSKMRRLFAVIVIASLLSLLGPWTRNRWQAQGRHSFPLGNCGKRNVSGRGALLHRNFLNITALKQIEACQDQLSQRLRDHQFYTRSLFEANIDASMSCDLSGIVTDANKQMEILTGCTGDELIGAPFRNYFTDPQRADTAIRRVLGEKQITDFELVARDRDGKETAVGWWNCTAADSG